MLNTAKKIAKRLIPKPWQTPISNSVWLLSCNLRKRSERIESRQLMLLAFLLRQTYNSVAEHRGHRPEINQFEVKVYSQNGEDGILLYIFSRIGATNRCFIEFGIGDGRECNTANLSLNFGWHGLLMDSDAKQLANAKHYYKDKLGPRFSDIKIIQCSVTMENINEVLLDNVTEREPDLLSIDIDGNDYWVWKSIHVIKPRVVVIEYNASMGHEKSLAVKYDPEFDRFKKHSSGFYHGASLAALTKLAHTKGYLLAGCDSTGVNAFFIRRDAARQKITEVSIERAYFPNARRLESLSTVEQFECIQHLDFEYT